MLITRMYCISKDPAMFITGSFYCICKNVFMFTLSKPSTFRIADATFLCFHIFRKFFRYRILIISGSTGCRWLVIIFFFNGFFPCARRSSSISLFNSSSYQSACSCATLFRSFFTVCAGFYMCCIHEDLSCIYKIIFHTVFQYL